jgi:hypothetical protein
VSSFDKPAEDFSSFGYRIKTLIEKWRAYDPKAPFMSKAYDQKLVCADELEAILRDAIAEESKSGKLGEKP